MLAFSNLTCLEGNHTYSGSFTLKLVATVLLSDVSSTLSLKEKKSFTKLQLTRQNAAKYC